MGDRSWYWYHRWQGKGTWPHKYTAFSLHHSHWWRIRSALSGTYCLIRVSVGQSEVNALCMMNNNCAVGTVDVIECSFPLSRVVCHCKYVTSVVWSKEDNGTALLLHWLHSLYIHSFDFELQVMLSAKASKFAVCKICNWWSLLNTAVQ